MKKFEVGKTYYSRSICDNECIFTIKVVKRTEKSVTYIYEGKQRRSMIKIKENATDQDKTLLLRLSERNVLQKG